MRFFNKQEVNRYIAKTPWKGVLAAMLVIITGGITVNTLTGSTLFFSCLSQLPNLRYLLSSVTALGMLAGAILWAYEQNFLPLKRLYQSEQVTPRPCLILFVSDPNYAIQFDPAPSITYKGTTTILKPGTLEQGIMNLNNLKPWLNWQQLLRGILPHYKNRELRTIFLIGSKESSKFLPEAERFIHFYCPELRIEYEKNQGDENRGVDFENFDALTGCLDSTVKRMCKEFSHEEKDIIIDVTGGQKTTSIAAAMYTSRSRVIFQYVKTRPNKNDEAHNIIEYDIVYQTPVSRG